MSPGIALVRRPPRSYREYYLRHGVDIDLALADRQHAAYAGALASAGLTIQAIEPDERFADGVFIEDTAVVWQGRALVTRMASHREGEQVGIIGHLQRTHEIVRLPEAATLDGGDVLHGDNLTYVGRSSRTNAVGAAALREFLAAAGRAVVEIPVERCLHLKSAATWLGDDTLLAAADLVDVERFNDVLVLPTAVGEKKAANALRIGGHLLTLAGYPGTTRMLRTFAGDRGISVHELDVSEFEKGDGSLTCLSIII